MLNNEKQTSVAVMYCRFMYNEFFLKVILYGLIAKVVFISNMSSLLRTDQINK